MRLELFSGDSGGGHVSQDCPRVGWTHIVILRRLEIDHYIHVKVTHVVTIIVAHAL